MSGKVRVYAWMVKNGRKTIEEISEEYREAVSAELIA
jgi:hypothetical protein